MADSDQATDARVIHEEEKNLRNLFRVVGGFIAWPALSISLIFLIDIDEHLLHIAGLFPVGVAGLLIFFNAGRLAARFAPEA